MRSYFATLQQLTIPAGAGASSPAISLGPDVPPEVAALYAPATVIACMTFRRNSATYLYEALVVPTVGTPFIAVGGIESVSGIIREAYRVRPAFAGITTTFGALGGSTVELAGATNITGSTAVTGPWSWDGVSAPRALAGWDGRSGGTGAIGTTYTEVLTVTGMTFRAGRAYRLELAGTGTASASTNVLQFASNWDPGSGDIAFWQPGAFGPSGASPAIATYTSTIVKNATGADKTGTWRMYLRAQDAGTVEWLGPRHIAAWDVGAASSFPSALDVP